jgi:hypothetical protein
MVKSFEDRHAPKPLVVERLEDAFGDGDRPVFAHGAEAGLAIPLAQQRREKRLR